MTIKVKTKSGNVGVIDIGDLIYDGFLFSVYSENINVPKEIQEDINKNIEEIKIERIKSWENFRRLNSELVSKKKPVWSKKPVVIDLQYFNVLMEARKPVSYSISTCFCDAEDEFLECVSEIEVDVIESEEKIKEFINCIVKNSQTTQRKQERRGIS